MDAPDDVADDLYGAPFDEFIARRDAAARALRKEKRREEADAVKALRKPALSAWAIDQLVRRDRDAVDGLLAAGAALRQARGGDTLRDATHEEREAVDDLAERATALLREAGHTVTDKTAGEIRDTLHAAALDDEARELLDRGRLVQPQQAIGLAGFGLPATAGEPASQAEERPAKRQKSKPAQPAKAKREEAAERRKRIQAASRALSEAEAELERRERAVEGAERELARARAEVDAAREEVQRRQTALDEASG